MESTQHRGITRGDKYMCHVLATYGRTSRIISFLARPASRPLDEQMVSDAVLVLEGLSQMQQRVSTVIEERRATLLIRRGRPDLSTTTSPPEADTEVILAALARGAISPEKMSAAELIATDNYLKTACETLHLWMADKPPQRNPVVPRPRAASI